MYHQSAVILYSMYMYIGVALYYYVFIVVKNDQTTESSKYKFKTKKPTWCYCKNTNHVRKRQGKELPTTSNKSYTGRHPQAKSTSF